MEKGQGCCCCCLQNDCTPVNALSLPYRESLAPWLPKVSFLPPSCGTHSCSGRAGAWETLFLLCSTGAQAGEKPFSLGC